MQWRSSVAVPSRKLHFVRKPARSQDVRNLFFTVSNGVWSRIKSTWCRTWGVSSRRHLELQVLFPVAVGYPLCVFSPGVPVRVLVGENGLLRCEGLCWLGGSRAPITIARAHRRRWASPGRLAAPLGMCIVSASPPCCLIIGVHKPGKGTQGRKMSLRSNNQ